jgi:hypothetical protein
MPRGSPYAATDFTRTQPFSRTHFEDGGGKVAGGGGAERYAIVIDAGSTGSRIHIFKFLEGAAGELQLQFDKFDQLQPGLSSYADDPSKAADSLGPLLALAEATIPKKQQAATTISVGATAGLRLLGVEKADLILQEVRTWLRKHPFKVRCCAMLWLLCTCVAGEVAGCTWWSRPPMTGGMVLALVLQHLGLLLPGALLACRLLERGRWWTAACSNCLLVCCRL